MVVKNNNETNGIVSVWQTENVHNTAQLEFSLTISNLVKALVKAQQEMGVAKKDSKNPYFNSSYADLNSIRETALPVLNKHGIAVLQPTVVINGKNYVRTILVHESGEYVYSLTEIKVQKQNDPQAEGSGISYARRYGLQAIITMAATDDDGEAAVGRDLGRSETKSEMKTDVTVNEINKTNDPQTSTKSSFKRPSFVKSAQKVKAVNNNFTISNSELNTEQSSNEWGI
jgi:hypothetical protein